tara:strand:- start:49 stop:333 length:285 start_codon:yes stop_codon:yes gene_type:complete
MEETKLWQAVITQGLMDSLDKFFIIESKNSTYHIIAKEWLGSDDFHYCCELANLKPKKVLKIYNKFNQYKDYLTVETTRILLNEAFGRSKQLFM